MFLGDHEGIGTLRKHELRQSCVKLGIREDNVTCLNHHYLKDSPDVMWQTHHMAKTILHYVKSLDIDTVIVNCIDLQLLESMSNSLALIKFNSVICIFYVFNFSCSLSHLTTMESVAI